MYVCMYVCFEVFCQAQAQPCRGQTRMDGAEINKSLLALKVPWAGWGPLQIAFSCLKHLAEFDDFW